MLIHNKGCGVEHLSSFVVEYPTLDLSRSITIQVFTNRAGCSWLWYLCRQESWDQSIDGNGHHGDTPL